MALEVVASAAGHRATSDPCTWRRLALLWNVEPQLISAIPDGFDELCPQALEHLRTRRRVSSGRTVVFTAGMPFGEGGPAHSIWVERA